MLGLLLIFKGTLDIIAAVETKDVNPSWWLGLVAGILELLLGFWASQQLFPARGALLLLWVGFFALFRGISEIVVAFELRSPPATTSSSTPEARLGRMGPPPRRPGGEQQ